MPTKLTSTLTIADDLGALQNFIRQRQANWKVVRVHRAFLEKAYRGYIRDFARSGKYRTLKPHTYLAHGATLGKLYDQKPKCLDHIRERRRRANKVLAVCPYCGLPAGKITLDHYLPRDRRAFPHLSIFSFNLVPACLACQLTKGNLTPVFRLSIAQRRSRATNQKKHLRKLKKRSREKVSSKKLRPVQAPQRHLERILHPYLDDFLLNIVWKLVPRDPTKPLTTLRLVPTCKQLRQSALVRYHIRKLGLQERCRNEVAHLVRFTAKAFSNRNVTTIARARAEAEILLDSYLDKELTPNGLSSTFFRALRDQELVAEAVIRIAARLRPKRTVKSQGIRV